MFAALLSTRLRRFLVLTIAAPMLGRVLQRRAATMRRRHGASAAADRIERVAGLLRTPRTRRRGLSRLR